MKFNVSFERAVYFTKIGVYLARSWPPSRNATKWERLMHDVALLVSMGNVLCFIPLLLAAIPVYRTDSIILSETINVICGCFHCVMNAFCYRVHRKRMQILIYEMEDYVKNARSREKIILRFYMDKCWIYYMAVNVLNYLAIGLVLCGPLVSSLRFPTHAVYPFSVDSGFGMYLAYTQQVFIGLQISACLCTDTQIALIMWYTSARLEILAHEFRDTFRPERMSSLIEKHQQLLRQADEVSLIMSYMSFNSAAMCGTGIIFSGMQLVGTEMLGSSVHYGPTVIMCMLNLFTCAWPAENLLSTCDAMATAVFNTPWTDMPKGFVKDLQFVLLRCQRPVKVSIGGFLPMLSLRFYALFLSTAFSYFMTLRAVVTVKSDH